jgi:hypothetical protein
LIFVPAHQPILSKRTFQFLRALTRNNSKASIDANRQRYRDELVEPFRALLDCFGPFVSRLNLQFCVTGRVGDNFPRINRDIRFANDKTPYRPQMYLFFAEPSGEGGQLYIGASPEIVTCASASTAPSAFRLSSSLVARGEPSTAHGSKNNAAGSLVHMRAIVFHGKRRMDQTLRLAFAAGKLEETSGMDRAKKIHVCGRSPLDFSKGSLQNLSRDLSALFIRGFVQLEAIAVRA